MVCACGNCFPHSNRSGTSIPESSSNSNVLSAIPDIRIAMTIGNVYDTYAPTSGATSALSASLLGGVFMVSFSYPSETMKGLWGTRWMDYRRVSSPISESEFLTLIVNRRGGWPSQP